MTCKILSSDDYKPAVRDTESAISIDVKRSASSPLYLTDRHLFTTPLPAFPSAFAASLGGGKLGYEAFPPVLRHSRPPTDGYSFPLAPLFPRKPLLHSDLAIAPAFAQIREYINKRYQRVY